MRILHLSESLATGVLDVVMRLAREQRAIGHDVTVLYSARAEGPLSEELARALPGVEFESIGTPNHPRIWRVVTLRRRLRELSRRSPFEVVHLHSTFAGVAGRTVRLDSLVAYSPHGFSFLRGDTDPARQLLYKTLERMLAPRCDLIIGVSSDEVRIAHGELSATTALLTNVVDLDSLPSQPATGSPRPVVVNIGRWTRQKAPERFEAAADALCEIADFRWIGAATSDPRSPNVVGTGWLGRAETIRELRLADIMYFTSRWEGMPVGLMEAQAMGVPAVARRCVGVADVIIHGVTGIIVETDDEGLAALSELLSSPNRLRDMSKAAWLSRDRFSSNGYGERSIEVYRKAVHRGTGLSPSVPRRVN